MSILGISRAAEEAQASTPFLTLLSTPLMASLVLWNLYRSRLSRRLLGLPAGRVVLAAYLVWAWWWDRGTPRRGGRPLPMLRRARIWQGIREYFPSRLIHDGPIDPNRTYVVGLHPHGLVALGAWANFFPDNGALPGIDYRVLTISLNFKLPILRDLYMGMGLVDASRDSVQHLLRNGVSTVVVVGGAAEALDARPHTSDLTLYRRLGFIRLAMEHGADLIPVYTFGENNAYKQMVPNPPGSRVREWQEWLMAKMSFSVPLVFGQGGVLPFRVPITTVVGTPIRVDKTPFPTLGQVLDVQRKYIEALTALYNKYQPEFEPEGKPLRIVDKLDADFMGRMERKLEKAKRMSKL